METIEEAADKEYKKMYPIYKEEIGSTDIKSMFIKGATWQKEQMNFGFEEGYKACQKHFKDLKAKMYTEEEVKELFNSWLTKPPKWKNFDTWFETNKKK